MFFPVLFLLWFLPLVGALFLIFVRGTEEEVSRNARNFALFTSLVVFVLSLFLWFEFDAGADGFQFEERVAWFEFPGGYKLNYHVGIDGISIFFILLATLLTPICILASWTAIKDRVREYMIAFLVLETFMVGTFAALDLITFYIFFEGVLIPMFLIIGMWGGKRRVYSAFKFFLFTLTGSVLMLLAIFAIYYATLASGQFVQAGKIVGTTDIPTIIAFAKNTGFSDDLQTWLWLAFFASFAIKLPMWPVHTWLPDAHVEAPTAGSVILAGVLLKMGGYGFLRFSLPMFPDASIFFTPLIYTLSVIAIIYTSLVALAQEDMKKLIAYSSVAHMGFVTIGIFTGNVQGVQGSVIQMLSHGVVSAALFLIVGIVYDRQHSREIAHYGGLVERMPVYAAVFMLFMLASVGLPGTSGFVGEFLVLVGAFKANTWVAVLATTGIILGAAYMLYLYRRVIYGKLKLEHLKDIVDLTPREKLIFAPLVVLVFWMGIYPSSFLGVIDKSVGTLVTSYQAKMPKAPIKAAQAGQTWQTGQGR
ncbi:MAG: NADH-quinone oxidoreductase subunit M [Alphaproteobacteria bacterium]|nr:NADH-quinone oxidoreductase subunit M [Alphaproteobacteria bacterium]